MAHWHGNTVTFDHCKCMINIQFDDTLPAAERAILYASPEEMRVIRRNLHTEEATKLVARDEDGRASGLINNLNAKELVDPLNERLCSAHAELTGQNRWDTVLEENQRVNRVAQIASLIVPATIDDRISGLKDLLVYSFDVQRVLLVSWPDAFLTPDEINIIQAAVDLQFSPNKVIVS